MPCVKKASISKYLNPIQPYFISINPIESVVVEVFIYNLKVLS